MARLIWLLVGTALSGVAFVAALPPAQLGWLGWICFAPLLAAVQGTRFIVGFVAGLTSLTISYLFATSGYLYLERSLEGHSSWTITGCTFYGFAVSMLAGCWAERKPESKKIWPYAALAVCLEGCLLLVLPAHLCLTQAHSPFVVIASLGGVWLFSFAMWLANLWASQQFVDKRYQAMLSLIPVLAVGAIPWTNPNPDGPLVAAVQNNVTELGEMRRLHRTASENSPTLVVWPEYGCLAIVRRGDVAPLEQLSQEPGSAPLVAGFPDNFSPFPHNVAATYFQGKETGRYFKRKLFGGESKSAISGSIASYGVVDGNRIGLNICFDSCYPWILRDTARIHDVRFIALPNLDPESPHRFIAAVHAAFTPIRAAELGMPIVRADERSHSHIVDSWGRTVVQASPGPQIIQGRTGHPHITPARYLGDGFLYVCVLALLSLGFQKLSDDRKAKRLPVHQAR